MPTINDGLFRSLVIAAFSFGVSYVHWGLGAAGFAFGLLQFSGTIYMNFFDSVGQALIDEQGIIYFFAWYFGDFLILAASIIGVILNRKPRRR